MRLLFLCFFYSLATNAQITYLPNNTARDHQFFFLGENHGFRTNHEHALAMLRELKIKRPDLRYLLEESDLATSIVLNEAIQTQDTVALRALIARFGTTPMRTEETYRFYRGIMDLNRQYSDAPLQLLGVDIAVGGSQFAEEILATTTDEWLRAYLEQNRVRAQTAFDAPGSDWDRVRDELMYQNFREVIAHYDLADQPMFGVWGNFHTLQRPSKFANWLAARMTADELSVYTVYQVYRKSQQLLPWHFRYRKHRGEDYITVMNSSIGRRVLRRLGLDATSNHIVFDLAEIPARKVLSGVASKATLNEWIDALLVVQNAPANTPLNH